VLLNKPLQYVTSLAGDSLLRHKDMRRILREHGYEIGPRRTCGSVAPRNALVWARSHLACGGYAWCLVRDGRLATGSVAAIYGRAVSYFALIGKQMEIHDVTTNRDAAQAA